MLVWRQVRTASRRELSGHKLLGGGATGRILQQVYSYGRWVATTAVIYALLWRLPQFVLSHRASGAEVGYYSAGITFIAVFTLMNDSLRMVLLPRVAGIRTTSGRKEFRDSMRRWARPYFLVMGAVVLVSWAVQVFLLGAAYRPGIPVFIILSLGTIATLYGGLLNSLVHSHGVPYLDTAANSVKFVALGVGLLLVPADCVSVAALFASIAMLGEWGLVWIIRAREKACLDT